MGANKRRMKLGHRRTDLRRQLAEAVLRGEKTAAASLRDSFAPNTDEPMPEVGEQLLLVGRDDEPLGVVETTEVRATSVAPAGPAARRILTARPSAGAASGAGVGSRQQQTVLMRSRRASLKPWPPCSSRSPASTRTFE